MFPHGQIMRIVFVHHGPEYGGVEKHLIDLVERLDPAKFEIVILCFGRYDFAGAFSPRQSKNVKIITGLRRIRFYDYWKTFRRTRPELIVFESGSVGDFPWYGHVAGRLCHARGAIDFEHGMPPGISHVKVKGLRSLLRRLLGWRAWHGISRRLAWSVSDKIVTVSDSIRQALIKDYDCPAQKTLTIWNGVDVKNFSPFNNASAGLRARLGIDASECVLLAVARLTPHKRIEMIFDAMQALRNDGCAVRFLIAGSGPQEHALRRQCTQMGLDDAIVFLGQQSDVRPCYEAADVFVLSSESEGFPLSLAEAMTSGLPSIAMAVGGPAEMISSGEDGWLVNSPEELTAAIKYALNHPEERRRVGSRAQQKAVQQFSIETCTGKITELFLSMSY